ncbi:MAG: hypothetical protein COA96_16780 [SAR86 cluster bacterium]|uniref:Uncharacterized protein n=1 Tax=SAR86 cluster bacterium TaxID=2030880 RepID=A0A2A5AGA4_9GAMM|nr:MAG: hypothetical protein COA96_16780 [SAR86 cluster bacterium]
MRTIAASKIESIDPNTKVDIPSDSIGYHKINGEYRIYFAGEEGEYKADVATHGETKAERDERAADKTARRDAFDLLEQLETRIARGNFDMQTDGERAVKVLVRIVARLARRGGV